jgi:hypothetical protein
MLKIHLLNALNEIHFILSQFLVAFLKYFSLFILKLGMWIVRMRGDRLAEFNDPLKVFDVSLHSILYNFSNKYNNRNEKERKN